MCNIKIVPSFCVLCLLLNTASTATAATATATHRRRKRRTAIVAMAQTGGLVEEEEIGVETVGTAGADKGKGSNMIQLPLSTNLATLFVLLLCIVKPTSNIPYTSCLLLRQFTTETKLSLHCSFCACRTYIEVSETRNNVSCLSAWFQV